MAKAFYLAMILLDIVLAIQFAYWTGIQIAYGLSYVDHQAQLTPFWLFCACGNSVLYWIGQIGDDAGRLSRR